MSKITVAFIKAAMVYFVLAMLLGIHMSRTGAVYPSMPVHVHFNLLGWMSMMIYGVAYHILPRFSGQPLWNERLSVWHFWLANIGLIGMTLGWLLIGGPGGGAILYIFALVEGVSIICFALNMFNTVKAAPPAPPRPPARPKSPKPAAPAPQPTAKAKAPEAVAAAVETKAKKKTKPAAKKVTKEDKKEPREKDKKELKTDSSPVTAAAPVATTEPGDTKTPETTTSADEKEKGKKAPASGEGAD